MRRRPDFGRPDDLGEDPALGRKAETPSLGQKARHRRRAEDAVLPGCCLFRTAVMADVRERSPGGEKGRDLRIGGEGRGA